MTSNTVKFLKAALPIGSMAVVFYSALRFGATEPVQSNLIQVLVAGLLIVAGILVVKGAFPDPGRSVLVFSLLVVGYGVYRCSSAELSYGAWSDFAHFSTMLSMWIITLAWGGDRKWRMRFAVFLILVAGIEGVYGVIQFFSKNGQVLWASQYKQYIGRASGTLINPNHGAWLMSIGLMISVPLTVMARRSWTLRLLCGYVACVSLAGVILSFSRGAWIGVASGFFVLSFLFAWRSGFRLFGLSAVGVLVVGVVLGMGPTMNYLKENKRYSDIDIRMTAIWPAAVKIWQSNPIIGIGPQHFEDFYRPFRPAQSDAQNSPARVHNDYLNVLVEWGVVGGVFLVMGLGSIVWRCVDKVLSDGRRSARRGKDAALDLGLASAIAYTLVHAVTDFNLYIPVNALVFSILVGLVLAPECGTKATDAESGVASCLQKRVSCIGIGCLIVLFGVTIVVTRSRTLVEQRYLAKAQLNEVTVEQRLEYLLRAHDTEPQNPYTCYYIGEFFRIDSSEKGFTDPSGMRAAIQWYQKAIDLNSRNSMYWMGLGRSQHWLDDSAGALISFKQALTLDPNNYRIQAMYGWFLFERQEYVDAYRWLKRSQLISYGNNPVAKYYLERTEWKLRNLGNWPLSNTAILRDSNPQL